MGNSIISSPMVIALYLTMILHIVCVPRIVLTGISFNGLAKCLKLNTFNLYMRCHSRIPVAHLTAEHINLTMPLIVTFCLLYHTEWYAIKKDSFEEANKSFWSSVCLVLSERRELRTQEESLCQAFSLSFPTRAETSKKDCTLVCVQQKLSAGFYPLLNLCLNNTQATNQNMLGTKSEVTVCIDHCGFSLYQRWGRWLLLWLMAVETVGSLVPVLRRLIPD